MLVTSAPARPGEIGVLAVEAEGATLFAHPRQAQAPNGLGDLATAVFAAGLAQGLDLAAAAERATRAAAQGAAMAQAGDPPLVGLAERLLRAEPALRIEALA